LPGDHWLRAGDFSPTSAKPKHNKRRAAIKRKRAA
jgi:hypothetical protein